MTLSLRHLEIDDRQAYLLLSTYETERRRKQKGYHAFESIDSDLLQTPIWKTFRTIANWLDGKGCFVRLTDLHWVGYVQFVFAKFTPLIPMPGQLRNDVLLREYARGLPSIERAGRSDEELDALYNRILLPGLRSKAMKKFLYL